MKNDEVTILLVEDDEVDVEWIRRAFSKAQICNHIVAASNGVEAFEHLRGENGRPALGRPFLVLLDINMPKMDGLEFLTELRADAELKDSIVVVLTTSNHDRDRMTASKLSAAGYLLKDRVDKDFLALVECIEHFWTVAKFPDKRLILAEVRDDPIDKKMQSMERAIQSTSIYESR